MGKRVGTDGRGRYEKGGQQVGCFFSESTDTEKMQAVYGSTGIWAWLRYWYLDTENYITWMLMDKGFYDYDYSEPKKKKVLTPEDREIWSAEKLNAILGVKPKKPKTMTAEEMQRIAMAENADMSDG